MVRVWASQVALKVKTLPANAGNIRDTVSIPESGRSPGEGMATHSSILAWRIPWMKETDRLESIVLQIIRHNRNDLARMHTHGGSIGNYCRQNLQFSHWVVSDSLWRHESQHARPSCPSPTPGVYSNSFILCHPFLLLPPIPPRIRVFSNESIICIRWQKYWSFSFSISPSNEHSGLISFRMDWLDLLAV